MNRTIYVGDVIDWEFNNNINQIGVIMKKKCDGCKCFGGVGTPCKIGYKMENGKPLEDCPKPITRQGAFHAVREKDKLDRIKKLQDGVFGVK